jgi:hypothetical protein
MQLATGLNVVLCGVQEYQAMPSAKGDAAELPNVCWPTRAATAFPDAVSLQSVTELVSDSCVAGALGHHLSQGTGTLTSTQIHC